MANEAEERRITYYRSERLGVGNFGKVFRGLLDREVTVAVKRIDKIDNNVESDTLSKVTGHPNILRYYTTEEDIDFILMAIELCAASLEDLVLGDYKGPEVGDTREILRQMTEGVAYLHEKNVIHRDLKPANILISYPDGTTGPQIKLADFGISRVVHTSRRDLTVTRNVPSGTDGWMAPELFQPSERYTSAVDVFSLGLVFGYTATGGKHPFGDGLTVLRFNRIIQNQPMVMERKDLSVKDGSHELFGLIESMLDSNPSQRPTAEQIRIHEFFNNAPSDKDNKYEEEDDYVAPNPNPFNSIRFFLLFLLLLSHFYQPHFEPHVINGERNITRQENPPVEEVVVPIVNDQINPVEQPIAPPDMPPIEISPPNEFEINPIDQLKKLPVNEEQPDKKDDTVTIGGWLGKELGPALTGGDTFEIGGDLGRVLSRFDKIIKEYKKEN